MDTLSLTTGIHGSVMRLRDIVSFGSSRIDRPVRDGANEPDIPRGGSRCGARDTRRGHRSGRRAANTVARYMSADRTHCYVNVRPHWGS